MEKYSPNLRLILLANNTANIIAPIRSRTLLVRVAAPTEGEICEVLERSGKKEGWAAQRGLNERIARESGRNLRRALLMFESVHAQKYVSHVTHFILPSNLGMMLTKLRAARKSQTPHPSHHPTGKPSSRRSPAR
jgi:DNA polymerase III delta prime subunit